MAFPLTRGMSSAISGVPQSRYLYGVSRGGRLGGIGADPVPATPSIWDNISNFITGAGKVVTAATSTGGQVAKTVANVQTALAPPQSPVYPPTGMQPVYGGVSVPGTIFGVSPMTLLAGAGLIGVIGYVVLKKK